ncbi:hypothetical protein FRC12_011843 [Ceratobasidium sp. 428]|nr:hypothetical protein FRC12_011843 [Ceratobasidium sp. 428]
MSHRPCKRVKSVAEPTPAPETTLSATSSVVDTPAIRELGLLTWAKSDRDPDVLFNKELSSASSPLVPFSS